MTPCERCGACSWTGTVENPICPMCRKHKARGSREEMAKQIHLLREACLNIAGFLGGVSILTAEQVKERVVTALKETD